MFTGSKSFSLTLTPLIIITGNGLNPSKWTDMSFIEDPCYLNPSKLTDMSFIEDPCYLNPSKSTDMNLCRIPATSILQNQPIWIYAGSVLPLYFQSFKINWYTLSRALRRVCSGIPFVYPEPLIYYNEKPIRQNRFTIYNLYLQEFIYKSFTKLQVNWDERKNEIIYGLESWCGCIIFVKYWLIK